MEQYNDQSESWGSASVSVSSSFTNTATIAIFSVLRLAVLQLTTATSRSSRSGPRDSAPTLGSAQGYEGSQHNLFVSHCYEKLLAALLTKDYNDQFNDWLTYRANTCLYEQIINEILSLMSLKYRGKNTLLLFFLFVSWKICFTSSIFSIQMGQGWSLS